MKSNESNIPEFAPVDTLTYLQASSELESILQQMQANDCDIDRLALYTKRATALIAECRRRLTATDKELQTILADLRTAANI